MMKAEEFFRDAWDTIKMEGDFSDSPTAEQIYGETMAENVEYFILPEQTDADGTPYVYQNVPLKSVAERYRDELENDELTYTNRFKAAIEHARNVEFDDQDVDIRISRKSAASTDVCDGDIYLLEQTMEQLGL